MARRQNQPKSRVKDLAFKALKATLKGAIFYVLYYVFWSLVAPYAEMVPGLETSVEAFMTVYITLMVIGELTSGTIFQYFFGAAKALFVIAYLILSLNGGIMGIAFGNVSLLVDLRLFLTIAIILGLLALARSAIQAVNFMNERADFYSREIEPSINGREIQN